MNIEFLSLTKVIFTHKVHVALLALHSEKSKVVYRLCALLQNWESEGM